MGAKIRFSYVLTAPATEAGWKVLEADMACMQECGYDAVELQIADPAEFDEERFRKLSVVYNLPLCAFQTGGSYSSKGNCLSTKDDLIRSRTVTLLKLFVDLAARWKAVIVFGSLQGRLSDEPDKVLGAVRIRNAITEVGLYATRKQATLAFEPVNHLEVGFNNTISEVAEFVRGAKLGGFMMMIDTFHMNIEEKDMPASMGGIRDILAHVHLSETNRDVLGTGHWPVKKFLGELARMGYAGYCSIGVYNSKLQKQECIRKSMAFLCNVKGYLSRKNEIFNKQKESYHVFESDQVNGRR